jgi:hypothetical protein
MRWTANADNEKRQFHRFTPRRTVILLGLGDDVRCIPVSSLTVRHWARPRKYNARLYEAWYITIGTSYLVVLSPSSQLPLAHLIETDSAPLSLRKVACRKPAPRTSACRSLSTCSGESLNSTRTRRRRDRSLCSTPSTNMGESSSSLTWASSSRSGHGKSLSEFVALTIAYISQVRVSASGKATECTSHDFDHD